MPLVVGGDYPSGRDFRATIRSELPPSRVVAEEYRVSLRFHLLPSRWRTVMLGSYIGYVGATAYAIQPARAAGVGKVSAPPGVKII